MPKLIKTWDELKECTSETHILEIGDCNGWIHPKNDIDQNSFEGHHYLSTHTFYGGMNELSTRLLQQCGFDVELENWDEETENEVVIVGDGGRHRLATGALLAGMSLMADGPYSGFSPSRVGRKQSYCHTCIVGRKNPEMCEKCDRK
jgi:hypothetical protein